MNASIQSREHILNEIRQQFGIGLLQYPIVLYEPTLDDVSMHGLDLESCRQGLTINFREIRDWLISRGWLLSRQRRRHPSSFDDSIDDFFLTPAQFVGLSTAYHVTRHCHLDSILKLGILPGTPERQNSTDRIDCEGNIYLCQSLGSPTDAGKRGTHSAYWWWHHFSCNNRFNDPHWLILKINLANAPSHQLVRDLWSTSGVIVCGIDKIPVDAISLPETPNTNDA